MLFLPKYSPDLNPIEQLFAKLKTFKGLTPYEFICKAWTSQPERFKLNPLQQMPGPNI